MAIFEPDPTDKRMIRYRGMPVGLPDAEKLYKTILGASTQSESAGQPTSFMHQVLSTAVLNTSLQNATQPSRS